MGENLTRKFMDHIAYMQKSWGFIPKIIGGEKTIESRWYKNLKPPINKISAGDTIYFKNSGERIVLKAKVENFIVYSALNPQKVNKILKQYGADIGIEKSDIEFFFNKFKNKKYCILIFLKDIEEIKPFDINKRGFGNMASWISIEDINPIKI